MNTPRRDPTKTLGECKFKKDLRKKTACVRSFVNSKNCRKTNLGVTKLLHKPRKGSLQSRQQEPEVPGESTGFKKSDTEDRGIQILKSQFFCFFMIRQKLISKYR